MAQENNLKEERSVHGCLAPYSWANLPGVRTVRGRELHMSVKMKQEVSCLPLSFLYVILPRAHEMVLPRFRASLPRPPPLGMHSQTPSETHFTNHMGTLSSAKLTMKDTLLAMVGREHTLAKEMCCEEISHSGGRHGWKRGCV